jgi:1-acyl-sn-glycerol-3-phosphate acyltransferase
MSATLAPSHLSHARGLVVALLCLLFLGFTSGDLRSSAGPNLQNVWLWWTAGGLVLGSVYWHGYRGTGFVPYAATGAAIACIWGAAGGWCEGTVAVAAVCLGLAFVRLAVFVLACGWDWPAVLPFLALCCCSLFGSTGLSIPGAVAASVTVFAVFAWYWFFRPWFELTCEPVMWRMYHIRAVGPGFKEMSPSGPCIILANHASWLDPLFLVKVVPRRITGMMTAKFHETPVLGWLARRFNVIRVPENALKQQDTPEIRDTVAALDRGECVVIFPEGYLRRSEEKPLRRFGRGVWQILRERPNTPVYAIWIEGSWGSYCSYWNGPPAKNKKPDRRRRIDMCSSAAVTVPADVLENHMQTRMYLMNLVLGARAHLGLPAFSPVELPAKEEDDPA